MAGRGAAARETQDTEQWGPRAARKEAFKTKRRRQERDADHELIRQYNGGGAAELSLESQ